MKPKHNTPSKLMDTIQKIFSQSSISIESILKTSGPSAFGVILLILSLPSALPVPAPGYSTPFGVALLLIGWQMILGKKYPWLPQKLATKKISLGHKDGLKQKIEWFVGFFTALIRPRYGYMYSRGMYKLYGVLIALGGASMILPIPLTNTPPAFGIFLLGMGMIEEDGIFGFLGACACFAGVILTSCILIFGVAAVRTAIGYVF